MKTLAVIPARYQSSRFPGKPLALIKNKPMIYWVYNRVKKCSKIDKVVVATDDMRIFKVVSEFGGDVIMTSNKHNSGTDRIYEAYELMNEKYDIILNIQGDEPLIKKEMIEVLIDSFIDENVHMATLKKKITVNDEIINPNVVKVITDISNDAIYFSRSTMPYNRDEKNIEYYKHVGVYGYTCEFLKKFTELNSSSLENIEKLEQLRAIENGFKIRVVETEYQSIGVDLPEHIMLIEKEMNDGGLYE